MYVGKRISPAVVSLGNTTAWECREKPPFVTRVASRAHPFAGCRGAATEAARSAGKGRFGGNVETRISPAVVSPGNTTAWGRRKKASLCQRQVRRECRNEDFSGCCFARKYDGMGTSEKSLPLSKGGLEGMSKRGFLRLLLRPEIQLHGDAEKKASLCQREVWRECRNEDFSGCYFARKYNCMGTPEKSHCSRILFSKKRR